MLQVINREAVYEKCKLKIEDIPFNLIFTTKFNYSLVLFTIIS